MATLPAGPLDRIAPDLRALAVPIASLRLAPDNARRHSPDRDVPALMASLEAFGQRKPIVAKRTYRGAENVVIAGNGTLAAATRLGWHALAVVWFEGDDDAARAFAIADNRTAELSEWDADALAALRADGVDLAALWHDEADLAALLSEPVTDADWRAAFDALPAGERPAIQQVTFTLSDAQAERVGAAIAAAKRLGPFDDPGNANSNGCALARICEAFLAAEARA